MASNSEIVDFFAGQNVLLTGGTGFVGKVLIEKLIRQCPNVGKIYVLIRPKKDKMPQRRMDDILNTKIFEHLRETRPDFTSKLHLINADCGQERLGLAEEDRRRLLADTSVVVHAAANVKFDQDLRTAINTNVRSTDCLLELARQMPRLQAFVHVSTIFSFCPLPEIDERFYDMPTSFDRLQTLLDVVDDDLLTSITPALLGKWPNTYVYAKAVAEKLVQEKEGQLPVAVVRPAIVTSAYKEPCPGWIDNFYGPIGIVAAASLGVLRSLNGKLNNTAHIVPVDYVANLILAVACLLGKGAAEGRRGEEARIYNFYGSETNNITWKKFNQEIEKVAWNYPSERVVWYYCFSIRESTLWHNIIVFFFHTLQSYVVDFVLICVGRKPIAVQAYKRLNRLLSLLSYFSLRTWTFRSQNTDQLWTHMNDEDKKLFHFNMDTLDWSAYIDKSIESGRVYLLKDPLDTIPKGQRKVKILAVAHYSILAIFAYLFYKFLFFLLSSVIF